MLSAGVFFLFFLLLSLLLLFSSVGVFFAAFFVSAFFAAAFFFEGAFFALLSSRVLFLLLLFFTGAFELVFSLPCSVSLSLHLLSQNLRECVCIIRNRLCQCTYFSNGTGSNSTRNAMPIQGAIFNGVGYVHGNTANARVSLSIYARCTSTAAFTSSSEENRISIR